MITPQVVANLYAMHTPGTTDQSINGFLIRERADHLENLDIEALEELLDPGVIWLNVLRPLLAIRHIYLNRRLKRATQCRCTVSKTFIRLKLGKRLD